MKIPVAVEPERGIFVYIDAGMGTRSGPDYRALLTGTFGISSGRRTTASRWWRWSRSRNISTAPGGGSSIGEGAPGGEDSQQAAPVRQAVADADWAMVERHGGFDVVMEKIVQWEQENPASNGRGMIDDFRLWGSSRWSRTNAPPKKPRWRTWVARDFNPPNAFLSEGGAVAVVVESFPRSGVRRGRSPSPAPMYYIG